MQESSSHIQRTSDIDCPQDILDNQTPKKPDLTFLHIRIPPI